MALLELAALKVEAGRHRGVVRRDARGLRRRRRKVPQAHRHARRVVRFRLRRFQTVMGGPDGRTTRMGSHPQPTGFPADLYLEGSDQHRGWFHSSLLDLVHAQRRAAVQGAAHARLRGRRRRPEDVEVEGQRRVRRRRCADTLGAEILRLWVAATDYSGELIDLRRDPEARGRRLPPHPQYAALPAREHGGFRSGEARGPGRPNWSRWIATRSHRRRSWPRPCAADYDRYEFHLVVQRSQTYCSEDLGGFYLDVLKDRLYTTAPDSRAPPLARRPRLR